MLSVVLENKKYVFTGFLSFSRCIALNWTCIRKFCSSAQHEVVSVKVRSDRVGDETSPERLQRVYGRFVCVQTRRHFWCQGRRGRICRAWEFLVFFFFESKGFDLRGAQFRAHFQSSKCVQFSFELRRFGVCSRIGKVVPAFAWRYFCLVIAFSERVHLMDFLLGFF